MYSYANLAGFRVDCSFKKIKLFFLDLTNFSDGRSFISLEEVEHVLPNSPSHAGARERLVRVARGAGSLGASVQSALLPRGFRRSACVFFLVILSYLHDICLDQHLQVFFLLLLLFFPR